MKFRGFLFLIIPIIFISTFRFTSKENVYKENSVSSVKILSKDKKAKIKESISKKMNISSFKINEKDDSFILDIMGPKQYYEKYNVIPVGIDKTIINNVSFDVFITKDVEILDKNNNSFLLKERLSEKEMKRYFNYFCVESDNSVTFQVNKKIKMNELKTQKLEINYIMSDKIRSDRNFKKIDFKTKNKLEFTFVHKGIENPKFEIIEFSDSNFTNNKFRLVNDYNNFIDSENNSLLFSEKNFITNVEETMVSITLNPNISKHKYSQSDNGSYILNKDRIFYLVLK